LGRDSSVGIATGYGLDGLGIESGLGARFSTPDPTDPGAQPASCTMGTGSLPGVKIGRGVTLTPHPLLVPWSKKGRYIPLLPLWAVRTVESLSVCTRVHFTFTFDRGACTRDHCTSILQFFRTSLYITPQFHITALKAVCSDGSVSEYRLYSKEDGVPFMRPACNSVLLSLE
jgi:hypothetical protein